MWEEGFLGGLATGEAGVPLLEGSSPLLPWEGKEDSLTTVTDGTVKLQEHSHLIVLPLCPKPFSFLYGAHALMVLQGERPQWLGLPLVV